MESFCFVCFCFFKEVRWIIKHAILVDLQSVLMFWLLVIPLDIFRYFFGELLRFQSLLVLRWILAAVKVGSLVSFFCPLMHSEVKLVGFRESFHNYLNFLAMNLGNLAIVNGFCLDNQKVMNLSICERKYKERGKGKRSN